MAELSLEDWESSDVRRLTFELWDGEILLDGWYPSWTWKNNGVAIRVLQRPSTAAGVPRSMNDTTIVSHNKRLKSSIKEPRSEMLPPGILPFLPY